MAEVNNMDVAGLLRRANRFMMELQLSVSAGGSLILQADLERIRSYIDSLQALHDHAVAQPELDLPETHPRAINIDLVPEFKELENEALTDLTYLLDLGRHELANSQSARQGAGLNKFDSRRIQALVAKTLAFLDEYIANFTPLDLPESSPMRDPTGQGRQGI